jgi:hypothetical protein
MKFVSDLRQVSGFLRVLRFPPPTARHKITEKLLKMAINTINHLNETKSNRVMDLISKVMKWLYLYIKLNDHGIHVPINVNTIFFFTIKVTFVFITEGKNMEILYTCIFITNFFFNFMNKHEV